MKLCLWTHRCTLPLSRQPVCAGLCRKQSHRKRNSNRQEQLAWLNVIPAGVMCTFSTCPTAYFMHSSVISHVAAAHQLAVSVPTPLMETNWLTFPHSQNFPKFFLSHREVQEAVAAQLQQLRMGVAAEKEPFKSPTPPHRHTHTHTPFSTYMPVNLGHFVTSVETTARSLPPAI